MFWDDLIDVSDPRWNETLRRLPKHDFYHLPAYLALEAERRGGIPRAYICQDDRGVFMVPFVLSPVPLVLQPTGAPPSDVLAPYGYAGPLVQFNGDERETRQFMTMALARLAEHLRHRNVCAILLRFNPMIPVPLEPFRAMGRLVLHGETVWSDLRQTPDQLWSETRSRFRSYIRSLQREGYTVELDPTGRELDAFISLYYDSMHRVGAGPEYFFSRSYFLALQKLLGERFLLAHVRSPAGVIVSSGIFTLSHGIVQYHLSGNNIGEEGSNALKLLLHSMRLWAREHGFEQFHLGGGVGAQNDPLFQFKSGFSPARSPFYTWRYIVDEEKYADLNLRWERINRALADSVDGYFPAYRKILPPPETISQRVCA
jgi:hypothetical protein